MVRRLSILIGTALLCGCGRSADLRPAEGQHLPVKPLMARTTPTANDLLTPPTYANPDRVDELIKKNQPRPSDRFDLPPADGGPAPTVRVGDEAQTNTTGPSNPE